jgi:hypothetical protein
MKDYIGAGGEPNFGSHHGVGRVVALSKDVWVVQPVQPEVAAMACQQLQTRVKQHRSYCIVSDGCYVLVRSGNRSQCALSGLSVLLGSDQ